MSRPPVRHETWDLPPQNRWALKHIDEILKVAPVSRGQGPVRALAERPQDLDPLPVRRGDGSETTLGAILAETYSDGLLVLKGGSIVYERYFDGMTPATLHLSQSVAKSITASLAGIYIGRGLIDPEAPLSETVPELARSAYAGATLRHVLDMRSGVRFGEDYTNPSHEVCKLDRASGWKPRNDPEAPGSIRAFILTLSQDLPHGGPFEYRSIETEIIAWACEAVGGARLPVLISREVWQKLGAERDASFTVDAEGTALADGGFSACLRDYGRFALMQLYDGAFNGQQIVPADWVRDCRRGDQDPMRENGADFLKRYPKGCYRNQWWVLDRETGLATARGAHGQLIYIDPRRDLAVVKLSSWPDFLDEALDIETHRMVAAIADHLCGT